MSRVIAGIFSILSEILQGTSVIYFSHKQDFHISSFTGLSVYNPSSLPEHNFALTLMLNLLVRTVFIFCYRGCKQGNKI